MSVMERLIVKLDERPWHAAYRVAVGSVITPAWLIVFDTEASGWNLLVFFFGTLLTLRVLPGVIRRALPFSTGVRAVWATRREMGKKYDSYQWQKLFWIGLGLAIYAVFSREHRADVLFLTIACLIAGAGGVAAWYRRSGLQK